MSRFSSKLRRIGPVVLLALALTLGVAPGSDNAATNNTEAGSDSLLGNYLAGRYARGQHETATAARFYEKALAKDPTNAVIQEQTFLLEAAAGNWDLATPLARKVVANNKKHIIARFTLGVAAFREGKLAEAKKHFEATRKELLPDLTARLARAWILLADDKPNAAFKMLAPMKKHEWSRFLQRYHKGLMADLAGRRSVARRSFARAFKKHERVSRVANAYARHAANAGDTRLAKQVLRRHISRASEPRLARALLADIRAGRKPELLVRSPEEGLAEVFYLIGDAMTGQGRVVKGLIHLQLALLLKPEFPAAHIALGEVYVSMQKHEAAIAAYDHVDHGSPLWMNVKIQKAYSLNALERLDEAKALLERLASAFPKETSPLDALGNILRSHRRFEEAKDYLSRAIALVRKPSEQHWTLYYFRGVCFEQLKRWPEAEKDFKKALKLSPDQAVVLNYLGYSWIDQGRNLKRAMALVRKAVKLKPESGEYVDSLGWAYYRMGKYRKAVEQLERAVELKPDDPVINDHLGDAYWKVGRRLEAKFQWTQALSLKPEPAEEEKIRRKLAQGLESKRQTNAQVGKLKSGGKRKN